MELTPEFQKKHKILLVELFRNLIAFLEDNNLEYCAAYGTVLGAVRHHGIIPWDDDIDIFMPRNEYNRFLTLKQKAATQGLEMIATADDKGYHPFIKICNPSTTLYEMKYVHRLMGLFIDVFPLDFFDDVESLKEAQRTANKLSQDYINSISHHSYKALWNRITRQKGMIPYMTFVKSKNPFANPIKCNQKYLDFERNLHRDHGKYAEFLCDAVPGRVFKGEWFEEMIDCEFEGFTVKIPKQYDEYLACCYGDYMQLPPIEKQVTHHSIEYYNLKERLSFEEVKERIRQGKILEY